LGDVRQMPAVGEVAARVHHGMVICHTIFWSLHHLLATAGLQDAGSCHGTRLFFFVLFFCTHPCSPSICTSSFLHSYEAQTHSDRSTDRHTKPLGNRRNQSSKGTTASKLGNVPAVVS
jgi:hypothetical protein